MMHAYECAEFSTPHLSFRESNSEFEFREVKSTATQSYNNENNSYINDSSSENHVNKKRLDGFKRNFSSQLIRLIKEQQFEYGFDSPADVLVSSCMLLNESITKEWLNDIYNEHYGDTNLVVGLLRVVSRFSYDQISPQGMTMALAAIPHKNQEVRETAIRAFESWGNLESLKILENVSVEESWLSEYLQQVISDLKEELE